MSFIRTGKENAVPIDPAPKITILAINYSLKINFLIKNNKAIISTLANIIKNINDIFVKKLKSKKLKLSIPYKVEVAVFVSVNIDNLNECSKLKLSKVKILDKTNTAIIKEIKIKNAIFESSSLILTSELNKFRLNILIGLTNL